VRILGIGDHVNCGSALVEDGKVVAAITDERLVREKMVFGVPRESVKTIMKMLGVAPEDIDAVAVATNRQHLIDGYVDFKDGWFGLQRGKYKQYLFDMASTVSKYQSWFPFMNNIYYTLRKPAFEKRRNGLKKIFAEEFGLSCPVYFMEHHLCHAASAYYTSGFKEATVFTVDGGGDGKSGTVYDVVDGKFTQLAAIESFASLGNFYSYITQLCGFKGGRHEGKITGMAAYGKPIYIQQLRSLLLEENGNFKNVGHVFFNSALKELEKILPPDFKHTDLAASVQEHAENMVVGLVRYWLDQTQHFNVALAGGVCANVKINQRVHEIPQVQSLFVHPGMSDEGVPVGAALRLYYKLSQKAYDPKFPTMEHVYLGPEYTNEEISAELQKAGIQATYYEQVEPQIARLLVDGKVVARFNGRMEYGPRALGNRTILYKGDDCSINHWLNQCLNRTEFMPFAPVVMAEHAEKCFVGLEGVKNAARFMTVTFNCTEWMAKANPGVVHIDNTARPQLVSEADNPSMYRILAEFYKVTQNPCLINTSFNMHEEPIVCTPSDAIRAFTLGKLDSLAIGNWIAVNPNPVARNVDTSKFDGYLSRQGVVKKS